MKELLTKLKQAGVQLRLDGDRLAVAAPKGALTAELREALAAHKEKLLSLLRNAGEQEELPAFTPRPDQRHAPFPLTDVQHAYWMGRHDYLELGGFSTHVYTELERAGFDFERLESSLQKVIRRHDMMRAVITEDGSQRILPEVPPYCIVLHDLRGKPAAERDAELADLRRCVSHNTLPADRWPLFEIQAARLDDDRLRLFICFDMLVSDASSMVMISQDWERFYDNPEWSPAPFQLSYRDYAEFERLLLKQPVFQRAKDYWTRRLDTLPPPPALPLAVSPATLKQVEFVRHEAVLPIAHWQCLKERAKAHGATASVLLMTAFSEVLRTWSREPDFTLNVTMFNRLPIHPEVGQLTGDFTTTNLLAVTARPDESFVDRLKRLQAQLATDLEYRQYSGMRVLRDRARRLGHAPGAAMPVVFTSTLALDSQEATAGGIAFDCDYLFGLSVTPQVWLDHQMTERKGQLMLFWDAVEALFPAGMLNDMLDSYVGLLRRLAEDENGWIQTVPLLSLPPWQEAERHAANATQADIPQKTLHGMVAEQALRTPDAPAVMTEAGQLSYAELHRHAYRLGRRLRELGAQPNSIVAVAMHKGWEQVAAILGVLHSGAAYLPLDPALPPARRRQLMELAQAAIAVTSSGLALQHGWPDSIQVVTLDDEKVLCQDDSPFEIVQSPQDLAYVLFTSGSTGQPKGVMIEHRNAGNTLQDINRRLHVGHGDRVLALSAAHFDLSVYDLFGVLSAGGALVIPSPDRQNDPVHWTELAQEHGVTLWNSVPQLLQVWGDHLRERGTSHPALRWIILSGDWIPVGLPAQVRAVCPNAHMLASGGPTETSIWCTRYLVGDMPAGQKSIPYGKPLSNQTMHIYNRLLEPCPVWTTGEIYIGGMGLGRGYLHDSERTAEQFIVHPRTGARLYKSGDLGRYLPGGDIEFQGREDFQVKLNGQRIELGEIEAALRQQPGVREAVVRLSALAENGRQQLVAYVVSGVAGCQPDRLADGLASLLPSYMVPRHYVRLEALPLSANGKLDYNGLPPPLQETGGDANVAPRDEQERRLFSIWRDVLACDGFGIRRSFFELGGDSLNATAVIGRVLKEFQLPASAQQALLQEMFLHPTIAEFSARMTQYRTSKGEIHD